MEICPPPHRAGGGREDMVGLYPVTLPFKCLLCDGEPLGVMRTKEEATPPILPLWLLGGEVGGVIVSHEASFHLSKPFGGRRVVVEAALLPWGFKCESARMI